MATAHRVAPWALLACIAGCGPKASNPVIATGASVHPDLQCPPGTLPAGTPPPQGREVWCELRPVGGAPVRQGPSIAWHENGKRAAQGPYLAGKRHGRWTFWHPNGVPAKQGSFAQGLEEGVWTAYHPHGDRASEGEYVGGEEHGPWLYWDVQEPARIEGTWALGKRTGRWLDIGPDGRPVRERVYRNGRLVNQQELGG